MVSCYLRYRRKRGELCEVAACTCQEFVGLVREVDYASSRSSLLRLCTTIVRIMFGSEMRGRRVRQLSMTSVVSAFKTVMRVVSVSMGRGVQCLNALLNKIPRRSRNDTFSRCSRRGKCVRRAARRRV